MQITLAQTIIGSLGLVMASVFTSWATASGSINKIETKVEVVAERENNHYAEVQKQLGEMSEILKAAPWAQNKTPIK